MDFDSLLDKYPPDNKVLVSKNHDERPPVSEGGRSAWLRKPYQDTLDLHGLTAAEAEASFNEFCIRYDAERSPESSGGSRKRSPFTGRIRTYSGGEKVSGIIG